MDHLSTSHSITKRLDQIKQSDEAAIAVLWNHYYPALASFAEKRLAALGVQQRVFNGDDVAASALASFFKAVQRDRFPDLNSEESLFRLLKRITIRKVIDRKRHSQTLKAGGGELRGESAFGSNSMSAFGIEGVQGDTPSPEWIAMMEEECKGLFTMLEDEELQTIACLRLEGYSNAEIASQRGYSIATVERRLKLIRARWSSE
jgi:DNA-directed RNA polymerase specialized sigma24 family protein